MSLVPDYLTHFTPNNQFGLDVLEWSSSFAVTFRIETQLGSGTLFACSTVFEDADDEFKFATKVEKPFDCFGSKEQFDSWGCKSHPGGIACDPDADDKVKNFYDVVRERAWFPIIATCPQFVVVFRREDVAYSIERLAYAWLCAQLSISEELLKDNKWGVKDKPKHEAFVNFYCAFSTWRRSGILRDDIEEFLKLFLDHYTFVDNILCNFVEPKRVFKVELSRNNTADSSNLISKSSEVQSHTVNDQGIVKFPFLSMCDDGRARLCFDTKDFGCDISFQSKSDLDCVDRMFASCLLVNGIYSIWSTPCS